MLVAMRLAPRAAVEVVAPPPPVRDDDGDDDAGNLDDFDD
jgi:hypothetical protein